MAKFLGRRKGAIQYQDLDDKNEGPSSLNSNERTNEELDIELTSVSVVPDGSYMLKVFLFIIII